jgi:hypothetical protein
MGVDDVFTGRVYYDRLRNVEVGGGVRMVGGVNYGVLMGRWHQQ